MTIDSPDIDQTFVENGLSVLDRQVREYGLDAANNARAAHLLPVLMLDRLLHLLACAQVDWLVAEKAASDVLDAYESVMHLVGAARHGERSADGESPGDCDSRPQSDRRGFRATMTPADFFNAFWIATVLGDSRRLDLLAETPVEDFVAHGVEADKFLYTWIETLQCFHGRDRQWGRKLGDTFWLSHPARVEVASADSLHYLLFPPIKLFYTLISGTEAEFNHELEDALVRHHYYWSSAADRELASEGWVSLPLTAIACMALSKGYRVVPESGYLPLALGLEKG